MSFALLALALAPTASAGQWTTGDILEPLVDDARLDFTASVTGSAGSTQMAVYYSAQTLSDQAIDVYLGAQQVGTITPTPYDLYPEVNFGIFDVSGQLVEGDNPIRLQGRNYGTVNIVEVGVYWTGLDIIGSCPGTVTFDISGIVPRGDFTLLSAASEGSKQVPNRAPYCGGIELGLSSQGLKVRAEGTSDFSGDGSLTVTLPAAACGSYVQVLDQTFCYVTGVEQL